MGFKRAENSVNLDRVIGIGEARGSRVRHSGCSRLFPDRDPWGPGGGAGSGARYRKSWVRDAAVITSIVGLAED